MAIPAQLQSFWSGKQRFAMLRDSRISALLTLSIKVKPQTLRKNPIIASYSFLANIFKQSTLQWTFCSEVFRYIMFVLSRLPKQWTFRYLRCFASELHFSTSIQFDCRICCITSFIARDTIRIDQKKKNTFIGINPGLGKIDCNRYSIAIFYTLYSSNVLEPLLFWMSIEYGLVFTIFSAQFDILYSILFVQVALSHFSNVKIIVGMSLRCFADNFFFF